MRALQSDLISPDSWRCRARRTACNWEDLQRKKVLFKSGGTIDLDFCPVKLNLAMTANILKDD